MKDTKTKKKKRRSRAAVKPTNNDSSRGGEEQNRIISSLTEAFESVSLKEANGDVNKVADIFTALSENSEDPSTTSSVSGGSWWLDLGSSSGSSSGYVETSCVQNAVNNNSKKVGSRQKKVVAASGTVANVLGKEYVRASPRKAAKFKEVVDDQNRLDEEFLYSMLGDHCQLSMAVVRDVLCQCGYNVDKALEALLDLSASSSVHSGNGNDDFNHKEDTRFVIASSDNLTEVSDCTSHSSEYDLYDNFWSTGSNCRNYSKVPANSEVSSPIKPSGISDLPQKVLESLFNISKSSEHEPNTMNWRNVVKKLQSLGPQFDVCPSSITEPKQELCDVAKGDEYQVYRNGAKQHWDAMKSSYQKATAAYSKGEWQYAAYLSEQGRSQTKLAQQADEKASQDIFKARNKDIENVITIDLHGQHVKPAMKLLKLHLLLGSYVQSIQTLRVITGCGRHGVGNSKLKQSVIKLVEQENVRWSEENRGTVLIKLDGRTEFSFLDSESDSE